MIRAPISLARATFARAAIGEESVSRTLGAITLLPGQREAIRRARASIGRFGGVLIADDVGSGKTFVALALAAAYQRPIVIAPAALRSTWARATARAHVTIAFTSLEAFGRGRTPAEPHDFVIIDEAHHLRNPATRRYAGVRALVDGKPVAMLSATPVHNTAADLDALLTLFLGIDARDLDDESRAQVVVRSSQSPSLPNVVVHAPVPMSDAPGVVAAIQALPPPVPPRDGHDAIALFRCALLRAWCSSVGAFGAMVRRTSLLAASLSDALRAGRRPTRAELRTWTGTTDDSQLAFAELLAAPDGDAADLLARIDAYQQAVTRLRDAARMYDTIDDERAVRVARLRKAHAGIPMLVCTQYAATVDALWKRLRFAPRVAALTARGARIASGAISRDDALARFAPLAQGVAPPHERERIDVLLTTDLISEGVNLHDAGVIVHLDMPWTAARLAQRVGRIARLGSPHERVHAYSIAPPRAAEAVLEMERRIRAKRRLASRLVGGEERVAALLGGAAHSAPSAAESRASLVRMLDPFAGGEGANTPIVCAVRAPQRGWLALVGPEQRFVARLVPGAAATDPRLVSRAVAWLTTGHECELPAGWERATADVERWIARDRARRLSGASRVNAARAHGKHLAAAVGTVTTALPHERARTAAHAAQAFRGSHSLLSNPQSPIANPQFPIENPQSPINNLRSPDSPIVLCLVIFVSDNVPSSAGAPL